MRVENLIGKDFEQACQALAQQAGKRMQPDMVIGIRRGGVWVMEAMKAAMNGDIHYGETALQRQGTAGKNRWSHLLQVLPQWLCNALRIVEAFALRLKRTVCKPELFPLEEIHFDSESETLLQQAPQKIWIVDDAVDSGKSMASLREKLQMYPHPHQVLYLALTVTEKQPLLMPDIYVYHEGVLLRFPWSNDTKKTRK